MLFTWLPVAHLAKVVFGFSAVKHVFLFPYSITWKQISKPRPLQGRLGLSSICWEALATERSIKLAPASLWLPLYFLCTPSSLELQGAPGLPGILSIPFLEISHFSKDGSSCWRMVCRNQVLWGRCAHCCRGKSHGFHETTWLSCLILLSSPPSSTFQVPVIF